MKELVIRRGKEEIRLHTGGSSALLLVNNAIEASWFSVTGEVLIGRGTGPFTHGGFNPPHQNSGSR